MNATHPRARPEPGDDLRIPETELAGQALRFAAEAESPMLFRHSMRTYFYARGAARERGLRADADFDDEALFLACVLHDIGLTEAGNGAARFEVDGADLAVSFARERGLDEARARVLWTAIALHTTGGIAERLGTESALTRAGVQADLFGVSNPEDSALRRAVEAAYPRPADGAPVMDAIAEAIVAQVAERPGKAERYTLAAHLAAEHGVPLPPPVPIDVD